ncbi:MAG: FAD-dependent oxidoreductase, partial [Pseudomonadota bacterium]
GQAPERLIDSYHVERKHAALENIKNSARSADFLTPRSPAHALFRDAVLDLAETHAFARPMVNSGRLSTPAVYHGSPLNGLDEMAGAALGQPGSPCPDAPVADGYLLDHLAGDFVVLGVGFDVPERLDAQGVAVRGLTVAPTAMLRDRLVGGAECGVLLVRPDQHIAARWRKLDLAAIRAAVDGALAKD